MEQRLRFSQAKKFSQSYFYTQDPVQAAYRRGWLQDRRSLDLGLPAPRQVARKTSDSAFSLEGWQAGAAAASGLPNPFKMLVLPGSDTAAWRPFTSSHPHHLFVP